MSYRHIPAASTCILTWPSSFSVCLSPDFCLLIRMDWGPPWLTHISHTFQPEQVGGLELRDSSLVTSTSTLLRIRVRRLTSAHTDPRDLSEPQFPHLYNGHSIAAAASWRNGEPFLSSESQGEPFRVLLTTPDTGVSLPIQPGWMIHPSGKPLATVPKGSLLDL